MGLGKGCIRFWVRSDQNSGFHGNRKLPYGYNGENGASTFSRLFIIRSFSYLQAMMTCMSARTSSNFGLIGPPTAELAALERLKNSHRLIMGKTMSPLFLGFFDRILFILAGNDNIHESLNEFEIWPDPTTGFHGNIQGYDRKKTVTVSTFSRLFYICPFHT